MNKEWQAATKQGDLVEVRRLLQNGTDANSRDKHGQTALMNAALSGQVDLVRFLVEEGADLNVTAKHNLSALMLSLIAHHTEIARLLIEAGADVNIRSSLNFHGKTALTLAEEAGYDEIVTLLKQREATP